MNKHSVLRIAPSILFGLAILSLPITSFPTLIYLTGAVIIVSPAAALFVALLGVFWLPFQLLRGVVLPAEMRPFWYFFGAVLLSSALSFFLVLPRYQGLSHISAMFSALVSFAIGVGFYLVFVAWQQTPHRFMWTIRLVSIGGAAAILWSLAQLFVIAAFDGNYPRWMVEFHTLFSIRGLTSQFASSRVTGFAYEPSWLAHQLNLLYLPLWSASLITGYSAFSWRWKKITIEAVLLVCGIVVLFFSLSRIGMVTVFIVLAYLFWKFNQHISGKIIARWKHAKHAKISWVVVIVLTILFYVLLAAGVFYIATLFDPRLLRFFTVSQSATENVFTLANALAFAERMVYWAMGWNVFARYPLFGVGLGNLGFFAYTDLPNLSNILIEVQNMFEYGFLLNAKNLWVRLLVETGIVGFGLFVSWITVLWFTAQALKAHTNPLWRTIGWMGTLALLAYIPEGFSLDTFALPYIWLVAALISASAMLTRHATSEAPPAG
jgi:hypothetical protein